MHILFITHYYEPDSGAAAVRITRLTKQMRERGHTVTVLTTLPHYPQGVVREGYRGRFQIVEEIDGIRVIQVWLWATPSKKISRRLMSQLSFLVTCSLRGLFLKRPDVVFVENQPVFTGLAGWFVSRMKRAPYLANISDFWPEYLVAVGVLGETSPVYRVFRAIVNLTQRQATMIVGLYPGLLQSVTNRIGAGENREVIYSGSDLNRMHPEQDTTTFREKYDLTGKKIVSFIGAFVMYLDFDTMLAVAKHFVGRDDVVFIVIGTGPRSDELETRLAQGDLPNTRWLGWLDHDEIPQAWAASQLTYWAEHGNDLNRMSIRAKMFEAFSSGTPMAVAGEGVIADMIEASGAGIAVPYGDVDGLINAVARLIDDDVYHEHAAKAARAYAETHFDPSHIADRYESLFKRIVRKRD